jgi:hypothetical protein
MEIIAQKNWKKFVVLAVLMAHFSSAQASREVVLFGGGPTPNASQISIELNTRWIYDILQKHHPDQNIHTLYTDGNKTDVDVHIWEPADNEFKIYEPLARVFNKQRKNGYVYHSSHVAKNVLPSDSNTVATTLHNIITNTRESDDLLLIYQGHGGYNPSDTNKNYFRLWRNTQLTVTELEDLFDKANPQTTIRFVLPQCFSGAFSRLIYKNAQIKDGLAKGARCGFLAQREDRESEGCTDSVNTKDYKDYAYYFFSALDGKTIDGKPLLQDPDINKDGIVTFREAHIYTLVNAFSIDYSFSTSESYLENWQPWYLKWVPLPHNPDNIYNNIAIQIAARFGMEKQGKILVTKVKMRINELSNSIEVLEKDEENLKADINKLQKGIQLQLAIRWPSIEIPYTAQFRKILIEDIDIIQNFILTHQSYPVLVDKQKRLDDLDQVLLNHKRELVQLKKIFRMRKLARILGQFDQYSEDNEKNDYTDLVKCESAKL